MEDCALLTLYPTVAFCTRVTTRGEEAGRGGGGKAGEGALGRLASNLSSLVFQASFGVRRLIGVTEIEKGSSYGNQELKKKE